MWHMVRTGLRAIATGLALLAASFAAGWWHASRIERAYMALEAEVAGPGIPS